MICGNYRPISHHWLKAPTPELVSVFIKHNNFKDFNKFVNTSYSNIQANQNPMRNTERNTLNLQICRKVHQNDNRGTKCALWTPPSSTMEANEKKNSLGTRYTLGDNHH